MENSACDFASPITSPQHAGHRPILTAQLPNCSEPVKAFRASGTFSWLFFPFHLKEN